MPAKTLPDSPAAWAATLLGLRLRITLATHGLEIAPGTVHAPHVVTRPKLLLVQEGTLEYELSGQMIPLRAGSLLYRPALTFARWWAGRKTGCRIAYCEFTGGTDAPPAWNEPLLLTGAAAIDADGTIQHLRDFQLQEDLFAHLEAEAELKSLLIRFLRHAAFPGQAADSASCAAITRAIRHLGGQMTTPEAALRDLPARVGLSPGYFRTLFRRQTGLSARTFLTRIRLHNARELLRFAGVSVKQAAFATGFQDPLHFSKLYHSHFGQPPSADRRAAGQDPFPSQ